MNLPFCLIRQSALAATSEATDAIRAAFRDAIDAHAIPGFREPISSLSHLMAAIAFLIVGIRLVRRGRGNRTAMISLSVLVATSVFLLTMSAGYHMLGAGAARHIMRQLDVAGVFALIAGTVTPVHSILFRGFHRWAPLLLVWSIAIVGIVITITCPEILPPGADTTIFLAMGWGGLASFLILWRRFGFRFVRPLLCGGLAYTVGVSVLTMNRPVLIPGVVRAHEIWHLAVLIGLSLHYAFVFQFAGGNPRLSRASGSAVHNRHAERTRNAQRAPGRLKGDAHESHDHNGLRAA